MAAHPKLRFFLRFARVLAAALCLFACAGFAALWMRSYVWRDSLYWAWPDGRRLIRVDSFMGRPHLFHNRSSRPFLGPGLLTSAERLADDPFDYDYTGPHVMGFRVGKFSSWDHVAVPYWFLTASTAVAVWRLVLGGWRRFSLRAAIVATTLVAVVLGVSVMATEMTRPYQRTHWEGTWPPRP
jgi:hypothetical protein